MQNDSPLMLSLQRGLSRCCPACGTPGMFTGYLKIADHCSNCQLEFDKIRSDDAPAYFTIAIVGHVLLPIISYLEFCYHFSITTHIIVWPPIIVGMTLGLLPFMKGLMMAVMWRVRVKPDS